MIYSYSHINVITVEVKLKEIFKKKNDKNDNNDIVVTLQNERFYHEIQQVNSHKNNTTLNVDVSLLFVFSPQI